MSTRKFVVPFLAVCVLAGAVLAGDAWSKRKLDYGQCMLDEMRGQVAQMQPIAELKCAKRSGKEVEFKVSEAGPEWTGTDTGMWITFKATDRRVTRGTFQFSSKSCEEAGILDFVVARTWSGHAIGMIVEDLNITEEERKKGFVEAKCMRTAVLYGVYHRDESLWTRLTGWDENWFG